MPIAADLRSFSDDAPPEGRSPYLVPPSRTPIAVVPYDEAWPGRFAQISAHIRGLLGARALRIEHVGSTSVPGLAAKPIIDIDLTVADPADEDAYIPALTAAGWVHTVREPWWYEHRMLKLTDPLVNLHVFGPDSPETWRHTILREHLSRDPADREQYAAIKRESALLATAARETVDDYNSRKERVLREIIGRAMDAAGVPS
ncbi:MULTISPECIES: GrpB family protein [unclassified Microbacterium]|uniref:GrpB family protein n=1 Tax=unclassified Microbacterium TaxID=2609290 RepID=UPI0012FA7D53|nr:GrpB family protein [Microbacterium sp. MAH-37]MVQ42564.1 GrpB family protein [Microbacterium sp. MAH-37]